MGTSVDSVLFLKLNPRRRVFLLVAFLLQTQVSWASEGDWAVFIFPQNKSNASSAEQIETLTWQILSRREAVQRARFLPTRESEFATQASAHLKDALTLLVEDKAHRRTPELLDRASAAYFACKGALESVPLDTIADVYRILFVATARGDEKELAGEYLRAYLNTHSRPDVNTLPADLQSFAGSVKAKWEIGEFGSLEVISSPPGASVEQNGKMIGHAPLTLEARPGLHHLRLVSDGHFPAGWMGEIDSGKTRKERINLEEHPSRTRYESAVAHLASASDLSPVASEAAADILRLANASRILALRVQLTDGGYAFRGFFAKAGGAVRIVDGLLARDASILTTYESLLSHLEKE